MKRPALLTDPHAWQLLGHGAANYVFESSQHVCGEGELGNIAASPVRVVWLMDSRFMHQQNSCKMHHTPQLRSLAGS